MFDQQHIKSLLSVNGLTDTSSDEEIKSVLLSAKWQKDDVETALTILRENTVTHKTRVETVRNVFNSDVRLKPEMMESLLGIHVDVTSKELEQITVARKHMSLRQTVGIVCGALVFAVLTLLVVMYVQGIGIFYPIA